MLDRKLATKASLAQCEEFYRFLDNEKVLSNYIHAVFEQHELCSDKEYMDVVNTIPNYYKQTPYLLFNHGLFIFRKTKEKRVFWEQIQMKWLNYLYRPLTSQQVTDFQKNVFQ